MTTAVILEGTPLSSLKVHPLSSLKAHPLSSSKSFIEDPVTCHPQLDWGSSVFLYSSENNLSKIIFGNEIGLFSYIIGTQRDYRQYIYALLWQKNKEMLKCYLSTNFITNGWSLQILFAHCCP
jgi:hypothetical protein